MRCVDIAHSKRKAGSMRSFDHLTIECAQCRVPVEIAKIRSSKQCVACPQCGLTDTLVKAQDDCLVAGIFLEDPALASLRTFQFTPVGFAAANRTPDQRALRTAL